MSDSKQRTPAEEKDLRGRTARWEAGPEWNGKEDATEPGEIMGTLGQAWNAQWKEDGPLAVEVGGRVRHFLRWTPDRGWMRFTGKVWGTIPDPAALDFIRRELFEIYTRAITSDPDRASYFADQIKGLLTYRKSQYVLGFLKGILTVKPERFDTHPDFLNCPNGVVDLKTGELLAHDYRYWMTKITAVEYSPVADHADWHTALKALPEDVLPYMHRRYGQAVTGHAVDDDVIRIQVGQGANGKSTIMTGIVNALGDYAAFVPEKVLLANPDAHPTELMTLRGVRFAVIEELPEDKHLPTKRLKDLAGTARMTARHMHKDYVSWEPTHTLFVNSNYRPGVSETDKGTWRRLALIDYPYTFIHPDDPIMSPTQVHGDPRLRDRLRNNEDGQQEAILTWLVYGAMVWHRNGQSPQPLKIQADTEAWRSETDLIVAFAQTELTFDATKAVICTELFGAFTRFLERSGHSKWTDRTFRARFEDHELFKANLAQRVRTRNLTNLTRPGYPHAPELASDQAFTYQGVAFK